MEKAYYIRDLKTRYYGIYLQEWSDGYLLTADNGADEFFTEKPTQEQIEAFADECRQLSWGI